MIQMMMMNARNGRSEMTRFVAMALSPFCYLLKDRKRLIFVITDINIGQVFFDDRFYILPVQPAVGASGLGDGDFCPSVDSDHFR